MRKLRCSEANRIDLVSYLDSLGYPPQKITGENYWYLSPLREERSASFKVDRRLNVWFDHGTGKGGTVVDFGTLYHRCTIREQLARLNNFPFFHQPVGFPAAYPDNAEQQSIAGEKKVKIISSQPIASPALIYYLRQRCIPMEIVNTCCQEVTFELGNRQFYAIGFRNNAGGYELRNSKFKGSSSPKDITFFDNNQEHVTVFEGFFSYLSFLTIHRDEPRLTNFLVLNSLAFFQKSRIIMENHRQVHLFLDRDAAGRKHTALALQWDEKYVDRSNGYENRKDLNEWLIEHRHLNKRLPAHRRHI